jgi:DNA segregation ATPase FtsK/SpoIIIE, S-DNA-T family
VTTRLVHRPARSVAPLGQAAPVDIAAPPVLPEGRAGGGLATLVPLAGSGVAMSMMMFLRGPGFAALGAVILVVSLGAAAGMYMTQRGQAGRKRRAQRELYVTYLERLRDDLGADEREFRDASLRRDPPAAHLPDVVADPARVWERRRPDIDFLRLRAGTGALPLRGLAVRDEGSVTSPTDEFMASEARAVARRFGHTPGLPLRIGLDRAGDVSLVGADRAAVLEVTRALLAQLAALHAPDDVTLAIVTDPAAEPDWAWARWLPHLLDRDRIGRSGPVPRLVPDMATLEALLADDLADRARAAAASLRGGDPAGAARGRARLVVVDDAHGRVARTLRGPDAALGPALLGITVLHLVADRLHEPSEVSRRLTVADGTLTLQDPAVAVAGVAPTVVTGTPDAAPAASVEALARQLAPLRLAPDSYDDGTGSPPADPRALLGLGDDPAHLEPARGWAPRPERDFLRVPLGVDEAGRAVLLDLKESAQLGMGPHGLCVGATGSGKSELLRTLVLALAVAHPPSDLATVLVDYKGGATFAPLAPLPHVAGLITNLSGDAALVERVYTSLDGEVLRRQQLLADAGRINDVTEYRHRHAHGQLPPGCPELPHLLVVIDEFGELLTAKPEFVELFLRLGRIGRSIGVHLLLSSQRVEQGKLRGLDTYLSYRIGLRTLSDAESRTVLDTPDAATLPALPGHGYLKVDVTTYQRFKAAFVSGPPGDGPAADQVPVPATPVLTPLARFGSVPATGDEEDVDTPVRRGTGPTLLSLVVERLAGAGAPVAPIWLPPLPDAVTLDVACGGLDVSEAGTRLRGVPAGGLPVPIGLLDDPARQWQGPLTVDLHAGGGHLLVVGGPGSGASTALRTVALGLAATVTPERVGVYGVDLHGSGLRGLAGLPHVGGVAGRDERERVRRTVDEVRSMLDAREVAFARLGLDTVDDLRAARAAGRLPELGCDEVVLLLDGWGRLGEDFEDLEPAVHDLVARGGRHGVHVVATARRWSEVRAAQQVAFAQRIELRMTEPAESAVDGRLARGVPAGVPGRALTTGKLYAQLALPRIDGLPDPSGSGLEAAAAVLSASWTGPLPPPVRVLPPVFGVGELDGTERGGVPFGRHENDLSTAVLDLGRDQHLLVLGDSGSGRTNLLRVLAEGLVRRCSPDELVFAVVDPRRGLEGVVGEDYLGGYAANPPRAAALAGSVAEQLAARAANGRGPGDPRIVLVVDDYDVLAASGTQPLAALVPHLAAGRDLGLHVLLTRRVMGASRGLYEPFTLGVRESGCAALVLSGDRSEGQLIGPVRASLLPPGRGVLVRPGEAPRTVQAAWAGDGAA